MKACLSVCGRTGLVMPARWAHPAHDPRGAMPVQAVSVAAKEDRALVTLAHRQVDRPRRARGERDGDHLAALAGDGQRPVAAFGAQRLDVRAGGLPATRSVRAGRSAHARPPRRAGGDQHRAELIAVQTGGMRLIVQPGTAHVRCRRVVEQVFLDRVLVETGDGAAPPGDGGPGPALASRSRAKRSTSARRAWNNRRWRSWHQAVNCRRSKA